MVVMPFRKGLLLSLLFVGSAIVVYFTWFVDDMLRFPGKKSFQNVTVTSLICLSRSNSVTRTTLQLKAVIDLAESSRVGVVNCRRLFEGNKEELDRALAYQKDLPKKALSDAWYINATKDCEQFVERRHYVTSSLTKDEADFTIAYSVLMYKDVEHFERLLRTIYRPQNVYCVHVDKKSNSSLFDAVRAIAGCLENVFVIEDRTAVTWGQYTTLEPEIKCMKALLKHNKNWKYFINLTGQEFPLKTNYELVQILKALNGSNHMEGSVKQRIRLLGRYARHLPPPIEVNLVKGSAHVVACRGFVDYVVHDETAAKFLEWNEKIECPDEMFFNTLNHNPRLKIPGSYLGEPETDPVKYPWIGRYKVWNFDRNPMPNQNCHGRYNRWICIFGVGDLPLLAERRELFANKFHLDYEQLALDCMQELINNRTRDYVIEDKTFNATYYGQLPSSKNHL